MVQFIADHRAVFGVEPICAVLPIAPSTYQRWTPSFRQLSGQIKVKSGVIGQAASGCDGAG